MQAGKVVAGDTRRVGHFHLGAHGRVEKTLLTQDCSACQAKIWLARHLPFEVKVNKQKPMLFVAQQFALSRTSKFRSFLDGSSPNPHRISSRSIFELYIPSCFGYTLQTVCYLEAMWSRGSPESERSDFSCSVSSEMFSLLAPFFSRFSRIAALEASQQARQLLVK
ncbi:hypothetical protein R3P38DRAFT_2793001 [Favolaschia claudopus]|uniref:Uncharacterized protein n=1 Tax=Favolaschia claudopus TaxID=2862362 RepID=A0AAW0AE03_9AGAR